MSKTATVRKRVMKKSSKIFAEWAAKHYVRKRKMPDYDYWRESVLRRDGRRCQVCGTGAKGQLVAHHLESYLSNPSLRTSIPNGITLCQTCHNQFHTLYGYGGNTASQFAEYREKKKRRKM